MNSEAWCAAIHWLAKSWTWLSDWTELNCKIIVQKLLFPTFLIKNSHTSSIFPERELVVWLLWVTSGLHEGKDPSSHPLSPPSPPVLNLFHHQGLFQWVSSSHQVAKVLELQFQHQSFQTDIQNWFPLGLAGWFSLQYKRLKSLL